MFPHFLQNHLGNKCMKPPYALCVSEDFAKLCCAVVAGYAAAPAASSSTAWNEGSDAQQQNASAEETL